MVYLNLQNPCELFYIDAWQSPCLMHLDSRFLHAGLSGRFRLLSTLTSLLDVARHCSCIQETVASVLFRHSNGAAGANLRRDEVLHLLSYSPSISASAVQVQMCTSC